MERGCVLVYGFAPKDARKVRKVADGLGVRPRVVAPEEYGRTLGSFVGRGGTAGESPDEAEAVTEEMLVFADVTDRQLDAFLSGLHTARVGVDALKAVLTETNARWTGGRLCRELQKERAAQEKR